MAGFRTAQEKSITQIGEELKSVYQAVLELPYDPPYSNSFDPPSNHRRQEYFLIRPAAD
jgi:hypothetical protein